MMDERTKELIAEYSEDYYVPKVSYELIPISELICNQNYQRELSHKQVTRTADNFDPFQINPVKVSKRDGHYYVINGQHTMEIIARISGSRDTPVWCMIYDEMDYTREATVFAEQMKYVRALTPYDIFVAKIEAGNQDSLMIKTVVETYCLTISNEVKTGNVCAVKTLENIYDRLGVDALSRTLRVCVSTWDGDSRSLTSNMLKGLAMLLAAYDDVIKDDIFVDKLGNVSIKELNRTAKDRRPGPAGFAEAMLVYYNKKSRSPISAETLYRFKFKKSNLREESVSRAIEQIEWQRDKSRELNKMIESGEIVVAGEMAEVDSRVMGNADMPGGSEENVGSSDSVNYVGPVDLGDEDVQEDLEVQAV